MTIKLNLLWSWKWAETRIFNSQLCWYPRWFVRNVSWQHRVIRKFSRILIRIIILTLYHCQASLDVCDFLIISLNSLLTSLQWRSESTRRKHEITSPAIVRWKFYPIARRGLDCSTRFRHIHQHKSELDFDCFLPLFFSFEISADTNISWVGEMMNSVDDDLSTIELAAKNKRCCVVVLMRSSENWLDSIIDVRFISAAMSSVASRDSNRMRHTHISSRHNNQSEILELTTAFTRSTFAVHWSFF